MYAFGPLPRQKRTGRVIGTHQKIDRVARRHLDKHVMSVPFPGIDAILHFEGGRGPDAIKLKTPDHDKPKHFINPSSITKNDPLLGIIDDHSHNLTAALSSQDAIRAAFEAAWLAHAVTDGLTPAHHEPYEDQIKELMREEEDRQNIRGKVMMTGNGSKRQFVRNNWQYWGAKGIMTTHTLFEAGVASTAKPLAFRQAAASEEDIDDLRKRGFRNTYIDMISAIDELKMYDRFKREGWTRALASQTTRTLLPTIIHAVELAWLEAYERTLEGNA